MYAKSSVNGKEDQDRSTTRLTSNRHSKKLKDLNEMTQKISKDLQRDTKKLEESYFRTNEIDKELGYSTALISDIGRARRKQRMICFFFFLFVIVGIFTFPFFRFKLFEFWQAHTSQNGGDPPVPPKDQPPDTPSNQGPIN
jgi:hypothetical protein